MIVIHSMKKIYDRIVLVCVDIIVLRNIDVVFTVIIKDAAI